MPYIGKDPGTGLRGRFIYTATAGQTSFTGADSLGRTLTYTDSEYTDVYLNGVKLDKTDYTATSGTSIVLDSGASASDILEVLAFDTFGLFSGEFAQDVSVAGALTVSGTTTTAATTMTGDLSLADKIVHTGDTNTTIRFPAADTVTIETAGSERVRVKDSGFVGVGTNAPDALLDVSGSGVPLEIDSTNSNTYKVQFKNDGTVTSYLGTAANSFFFANASAAQLLRVDSDGVKFGTDSAAANGLGDYEEGSFTATYVGGTSNPTVTYGNQIGRYVKIGQLVHCSIRINTNGVSGGGGALFISGLPFVAETVSSMFSTFAVGYSASWGTNNPQAGFMGTGNSIVQLLCNSATSALSQIGTSITVGDMNTASGATYNDVIGQITYRTS